MHSIKQGNNFGDRCGASNTKKENPLINQGVLLKMAPVTGLEPVTHRLTADCATIAPHRNEAELNLKALKSSPLLSYCQ